MILVIEVGILFGLFAFALKLNGLLSSAEKTLVLGNGVDAMNLLRDIDANSSVVRCGLIGFVGTNERQSSIPLEFRVEGEDNLLQLVAELEVERLVVALEPENLKDWAQQLLNCKLHGIKIVDSSALKSKPPVNRTHFHDRESVLQLP